jgi:hypothetical protein
MPSRSNALVWSRISANSGEMTNTVPTTTPNVDGN